MIRTVSDLTPLTDKALAVLASITALTIGHWNAIIALIVGLLTIALLIPRVIMAWRSLHEGKKEIKIDDD